MKKSSTFIYFVKSFFTDSDNNSELPEFEPEKYLTEMESTGLEPPEKSIKKILDFALSYDVLETETAGHVEMNLN